MSKSNPSGIVGSQNVVPPMETYSPKQSQCDQPTVPPTFFLEAVDLTTARMSTNNKDTDTIAKYGYMKFGNSFSEKAIRHSFIRKVYLILMVQLLVTFGFICLFSLVGTFLLTYIALIIFSTERRKYPGNFICLGVFTLALSYMVGTISSFYDTTIVFVAAGVTCLVCLAISLFTIQTKKKYGVSLLFFDIWVPISYPHLHIHHGMEYDETFTESLSMIEFTVCYGLLFVLVMVLFFFSWSCLIFYLVFPANVFVRRILDCVYGGLTALLFSLYLAFDTKMVVDGKTHELSPEEYVYGALQLYVDIVYLFLLLLALFGKRK